MLTSAEEKLFEGTWRLVVADDPRELDALPRIVLRDGVAWYADRPQGVGYYEVEGDRVVIGLPVGREGLNLITANVFRTVGTVELSGVIDISNGKEEGICEPCILLRTADGAGRAAVQHAEPQGLQA